jgi:hypothetical protein
MRCLFCVTAVALLPPAEPAPKTLTLTVSAGAEDRPAGPVVVPLALPAGLAGATARVRDAGGRAATAQLTAPALFDAAAAPAAQVRRELHLLLPPLKAGEAFDVRVEVGREPAGTTPGFAVTETAGRHVDLTLRGRPVLRYECAPLDDSTRARREATYKVFHHLFADDGTLVTKGPGGLYTHHRGLFYGFRRTTYDGNEVDIWHCTGDTAQVHEKTLLSEAGPVLGRHRVVIAWLGKGKEVFAREERELTVWDVPGGRLVEFASVLRPVKGAVKVDGDPQHAGFHFRAANEVADRTKAETYYVRPDGPGEPGATRNWPQDRGHVNLPWDAMSFVLGGQRYTAAYLDRPDNPKEARFSERDYGRFGSYFVAEATPEKALAVRYRVWLRRGAMTGKEVAALSAAFVRPPRVTVRE